jgi:DNA repair exonuclease SbcCD ATPase subunit
MIHKVWLRHWKAYDALDLELRPGANFLVARNGIGKTSIIQGLHFAFFGGSSIFGSGSSIENAVRGSEAPAVVGCELQLGSKNVEIERVVERTSGKPRTRMSVRIDGTSATEQEWLDLLRVETGVDASQLMLLAFVAEGETISVNDVGRNTVSLLSHVFGVDRLSQESIRLEQIAKRLDRESDELRKSMRDRPLRADAENAGQRRTEVSQLESDIDSLQERLHRLERQQADAQSRASYLGRKDSYSAAIRLAQDSMAEVFVEVAKELPELSLYNLATMDRIEIRMLISRFASAREDLILQRGRLEFSIETTRRNIDLLRTGDHVCPLCRQPLSSEDAQHAISEHMEIQHEAQDGLAHVERKTQALELVVRELDHLAALPVLDAPLLDEEVALSSPGDVSPDAEFLRSEIESLMARRQRAIDELRLMDQLHDERTRNESLAVRLYEGYRSAERAHLASKTMKSLANAISVERVSPLADELQKRWPHLNSGTSLIMGDGGALALGEGGHVIPYSELSGGQRTLAQLAVRLLALQMATRSPFLVLDEPLEHLDPKNRRSLATMLVNAAQSSTQLKQVIVTTYEESVTRRLSSAPIDSWPESKNSGSAHVVRISPTG